MEKYQSQIAVNEGQLHHAAKVFAVFSNRERIQRLSMPSAQQMHLRRKTAARMSKCMVASVRIDVGSTHAMQNRIEKTTLVPRVEQPLALTLA